VVSLKPAAGSLDVKLAGNLPGENLKVIITGGKDAVQVSITDLSGKMLYKNQFAGSQLPLEMALPALPRGVFALTVRQGTNIKTIQFIR
jgi:hypothetical protein